MDNKKALLKALYKLRSSQLSSLTRLMDLPEVFMPTPGGDLADQANAIFDLCKNTNRLGELKQELAELTGQKLSPAQASTPAPSSQANAPAPPPPPSGTSIGTDRQSVFISYGGPDEDFARKLNEALKSNGVQTWFFGDDALGGQKLHRMMAEGINNHDRVILVCSKSSLKRTGVHNEIEQLLAREAREGGSSVLIPIRLDDSVFGGDWAPDGKKDLVYQLKDRVIPDFAGTLNDQPKFDREFKRLLKTLAVNP